MKIMNPVAQAFIERIDVLIERVEYLEQHPNHEEEAVLVGDIKALSEDLLQVIPENLLGGEAGFLH